MADEKQSADDAKGAASSTPITAADLPKDELAPPLPKKAPRCHVCGGPLTPFTGPDPYGRAGTGFCDTCGERYPRKG